MDRQRPFKWTTAGPAIAVTLVAGLIFACQDNPLEPEFARVNHRYTLTVTGDGSMAGGVVTSDRGGISCTIRAGGGVSGKCSQGYKSGSIVTLTMTPASGAQVKGTTEACAPNPENLLSCHVTLTGNATVTVTFESRSNTFALSVSGGAAGSGTVGSSPAGINCTITGGTSGSTGCSTNYPLNQQVTLTATAASGSYLKAWAGAGCDAAGSGLGRTSGSCVVVMSQVQAVIVSFDRPANVALAGQWDSPFTWQALAIHASLLPNGKILTWGRSDHVPVLWDPATGSFGTATRPADLFCSGHALLPDGRLLVAGGHSGTDNQGIRSAKIYDYRTNSWTAGPDMRNGRWYPTNVTLATGEVLTVSGGDTAKALNTIPEVWTTSGTWRALTSAQSSIPYYPMLFVAPNGNVFVAGPNQATGYINTSGTGSTASGPARTFGSRDYGSAVMYDGGKIFMVGGGSPTGTAEVIDLNAGAPAWRSVAPMAVARRQMNATLLADGTVLVTGGSNASGFNTKPTDDRVLAAELWNPSTEQWKTLGRQTHYRLYHSTALLLPDGRVLSVGSGQPAAAGLTDDFTAEIYSPPYLFGPDGAPATRPAISSAPTTVSYGQTFAVGTPDAGAVAKVTWIRLGSVTHSTNMNQRMNILPFSASGSSSLSVTAPASGNIAPPGHYMLFLVNANGAPSVARIIQIQ